MLTLLLDNHDSFTYNLFQLLAEVNGTEPLVVRNDEATWEELGRLEFDNVVISPGPGRPEEPADFGVCAEVIRRCERPLLGVCLGMQGIGWVEGGTVERAPEPMHGRVAEIGHDDSPLFEGIPSPFRATRYHSLALRRPLPPTLREIAASEGVPMALEHRTRPQWGVQLHPESIATEHGARLLANFRGLTPQRKQRRVEFVPHSERNSTPAAETKLAVRTLDAVPDVEAAFVALYGDSDYAFWLDSSRPGERARFSFMGDAGGPLAEVIEHEAGKGVPLFDRLRQRLDELRPTELPDLPFEFDCGLVGYIGYEMKGECGFPQVHRSEHPDAAFLFCDRLVVFDHAEGRTYLLTLLTELGKEGEEIGADADGWLADTAALLESLGAAPADGASVGPLDLRLDRSEREYLSDIESCLSRLAEGQSYEICLTNKITADLAVDPLDLYRRLRRANPAPFAAYLRLGDRAVLSSSPERFLRVGRDGVAEARPIKGTSGRGRDAAEDAELAAALAASDKNRAENLMIVDLLRNDLGAVCEVGSVAVPEMMAVESYETVHQLVSAVTGRLRPEATALGAVRSCFPPGSMTGAPKLRTTEILDQLEGAARGVYSGAIGWFGLSGAADLSVAIRTVVLADGRAAIGAGGAVVLASEPEREWEEMLLKAAAPLRAIDPEADPASISLALQGAAAASPP
ncbi:MAG TPA: aminodeoxychorismate synthase component I [Solirubrobacterales bacterium]|nr:aminodeoxychorismate synthase component I [Solirubrobacterales bacterium]